MTPSESQRNGLARLLARSLPDWSDREAVASASSLRDVQLTGAAPRAWRALVDEAVAQGRLPALIRAAARRKPDDATLARLAGGLEHGRLLLPRPGRLALAFAAGVVVAGVYVWTTRSAPDKLDDGAEPVYAEDVDADRPTEPERPAVAASAEAERAPSAEAPDAAGDAATQAQAATPEVAEAPGEAGREQAPAAADVEPPNPEPERAAGADEDDARAEEAAAARAPAAPPAEAAAPSEARAPTPRPSSAPCAGQAGFAYLGADTELSVGDVWSVATAVNVRAEVPDANNDFNARSELRCVLPSGVRMRVEQAPIAVPGGAYWIPVRGEWFLP